MSRSHRPQASSQIRPNRKSIVESRTIPITKTLKPAALTIKTPRSGDDGDAYMKKIIALKRKYLRMTPESTFIVDPQTVYSPIGDLTIFKDKKLNETPVQLSQRLQKSLKRYQNTIPKKHPVKINKSVLVSPKKRSIISILQSEESVVQQNKNKLSIDNIISVKGVKEKFSHGSSFKKEKGKQNKYTDTPQHCTPSFLKDKLSSAKLQGQLNVFPLQLAQILTSFDKQHEKSAIKDIHRSIDATRREIKSDISRVVDSLKLELFSLIDTKIDRVIERVTPRNVR